MRKKILILCILLLCITGCSKVKEQAETESAKDTAIAESLVDSHYSYIKISTNAGRDSYDTGLANTQDFKKVGRELQRLSVEYFSPNNYVYSEGQILQRDDFDQLLARTNEEKGTSYPNSIQPDRGQEIGGVLNPIMVSLVHEQDFYIMENGEPVLKGVSFAIVLNPTTEGDKPLTTPMKDEDIKRYGETIIPKFYEYVSNKKELDGLPINICIYRGTNNIDSQINGAFILQNYSDNGLGETTEITQETVIFTSARAEELDNTTYTEFVQFRGALKGYSTDAVNMVGYGEYLDKELTTLRIDINVNVKTHGELSYLISKTQEHLESAFSKSVSIQVVIQTTDAVIAVITKEGEQAVEYIILQ